MTVNAVPVASAMTRALHDLSRVLTACGRDNAKIRNRMLGACALYVWEASAHSEKPEAIITSVSLALLASDYYGEAQRAFTRSLSRGLVRDLAQYTVHAAHIGSMEGGTPNGRADMMGVALAKSGVTISSLNGTTRPSKTSAADAVTAAAAVAKADPSPEPTADEIARAAATGDPDAPFGTLMKGGNDEPDTTIPPAPAPTEDVVSRDVNRAVTLTKWMPDMPMVLAGLSADTLAELLAAVQQEVDARAEETERHDFRSETVDTFKEEERVAA